MRRTRWQTADRFASAALTGRARAALLVAGLVIAFPVLQEPGADSSFGEHSERVVASMTNDLLAGLDGDAFPEDIQADQRLDGQARWPSGARAEFTVNESGAPDEAAAAVAAAASTWRRTGIGVQLEYVGSTEAVEPSADLDNVVSWIETPDDRDVFVARTTTYWYADEPDVIIGFDIAFNLDYEFGTEPADGVWDVETVALHELGHAIGLDHADPQRVLQIMRPRIEAGDVDRTLSLRDGDAVAALYRTDRAQAASGFFAARALSEESDKGPGADRTVEPQKPSAGLFP